MRAVLCVLLILVMRVLNLAVPILYKELVDLFADVFYPIVVLYMVAAFLQGGAGTGSMGAINNIRQYLWIPIQQDAFRRISVDVFRHTLNLDLNFHLHRKTGEMTRIMDRGTSSMQSVLSTVVFSIGPQIFDIAAACAYMATALQPWIAIIVFITLVSYIPLTVYLTEWRGQFRRDMNRLDNAKSAKATDALLGYETVKYFNNEEFERSNYEKAIVDYQRTEYRLIASLNGLNVLQSLVIWSGMFAGLIVCTKGVANGSLSVGDTVLFITILQQLYVPLNYFGTYYRSLQTSMIDLENLFDLFANSPQIQDKPDAKELAPTSAPSVSFEDVHFNYTPDSSILKGVTFGIAGGKTLALVGATGSGKTSVLRLLFRFYDPASGVIKINGIPITDVTQTSLRGQMAVVPQDTVLFNDTIKYNLRYGRHTASEAEVEEASQAASLHDTITQRFPQGYETMVGERGLRLSGGEKQRVAFARAILKDPSILLLDEATSSLDSLTERKIQEAMADRRQDRTMIIVAHRLSTIMDADVIVVLKEGEVAETGSHPDLIAKGGLFAGFAQRPAVCRRQGCQPSPSELSMPAAGGLYAEMWSRQAEASAIDKVCPGASSPRMLAMASQGCHKCEGA
eukprot:jgi/Astpho2/737/e_gw1.00015.6.1_t